MADGGMAGGAALARYLKNIADKVGNGEYVRVGFLEGATYPDGTSVAMVAAANEFGDPAHGRVARPFFRDVLAVGRLEWGGKLAKIMKATGNDAATALEHMGTLMRDEIQDAIIYFDDPPLKQSTIDRKGSAKPLVETKVMLRAVDYEVKS